MNYTSSKPIGAEAPTSVDGVFTFSHAYTRMCDRCCPRAVAEIENNPGTARIEVTAMAHKRHGKCSQCGAYGLLQMLLIWHGHEVCPCGDELEPLTPYGVTGVGGPGSDRTWLGCARCTFKNAEMAEFKTLLAFIASGEQDIDAVEALERLHCVSWDHVETLLIRGEMTVWRVERAIMLSVR